MNELQIFNSPKFGQIRTYIENDGSVTFCGADAATSLGYKDTVNALKQHCREDGVVFHHITDRLGRLQKAKFITEGNLYRLIAGSELPGADEFERWIFDEVLPSIRKHGAYVADKSQDKKVRSSDDRFAQLDAEARRMRAEAMALNAKNRAAKMLLSAYSEAGVSPQYKVLALRDVYAPAGINVPLEGVRTEPKTYDATTIAQMLGIYSTSGKAHAQAVSALIETIGVKDGECIRVPCQSLNGHSDSTLQYTGAVVERLRAWLQAHNYPTKFAKADGTRNFTVVYEVAS